MHNSALLILLAGTVLILVPLGLVALGIRAAMRHWHSKTRHRLVGLIVMGVGLLCALPAGGLYLLDRCAGISVYVFGYGSLVWWQWLEIPAFAGMTAGALLLGVPRLRSWLTAVLTVALLLCWSVSVPVYLFAYTDAVYTEVTSPAAVGETHELMFEETSYMLFGGDGAVYERLSPHLLKRIGTYRTDDGFPYVALDVATFDWREDGFTLHAWETKDFFYLPDE